MKALPRCEARAGGSTGASWSEDGRGWAESQNPPRLRHDERAVKQHFRNVTKMIDTKFYGCNMNENDKCKVAADEAICARPARHRIKDSVSCAGLGDHEGALILSIGGSCAVDW